ncbi:MAG: MCE family protein [Verrucomicrobiaceae bacterium]|nr:MCE family protein [Verrucomicrobiaceae bacterium]
MKEKRTELLVGFFLLISLVVLGGLIVQFGDFNEKFKKTYPLTVVFNDGGGLVKDTEIRLGGVKIGRVASQPRVNTEDYASAIVELDIFEGFEIPENATFMIGSSGLLGDSLIEITVPEERTGNSIKPGSKLIGKRNTDLSALASSAENLSTKGQLVLEDVRGALVDLGSAVGKLDQKILHEENLQNFNVAVREVTEAVEAINNRVLAKDNTDNIRDLLASLKSASTNLNAASEKVQPLLERGGKAIESLEAGIEKLSYAAEGVSKVTDKINNGDGLLPALLEDPEIKKELQAFLVNLRRSGIIRYRDSSNVDDPVENKPTARRKGFFGGRLN